MAPIEEFPRTVCSALVRASEGCISRKVTCLDKISILYLSPWAVQWWEKLSHQPQTFRFQKQSCCHSRIRDKISVDPRVKSDDHHLKKKSSSQLNWLLYTRSCYGGDLWKGFQKLLPPNKRLSILFLNT